MELIKYGKIEAKNSSDGMINLVVGLSDNSKLNIKVSTFEGLELNKIYKFFVSIKEGSTRTTTFLEKFANIKDLPLEEQDMVLRSFQASAPISGLALKERINVYLHKIENDIIKDVTTALIKKYEELFYTYPAAQKLHHAYVGGLAYHTLSMLDIVDQFIITYPYLDKNYLYSGIILHDVGKVIEFSDVQNTEYALEGQLIGHLVLGTMEIEEEAKKLGYENTEEVLILKHIVLSHHGQPQFGAAKRPMTSEAFLIWYLDTLDSKLRVLGDYLEGTEEGLFTEPIAVLDKFKYYKPKK